MNSKTYMVTGATSGIGKAVAHELAKTGEAVIMVARDEERGARVQKEISSATQNPNIDLQLCDLGNLSSVRNLATIVINRYEKIDLLINNASVYHKLRSVTVDGYETMFATNYLGPFLLTYLLLDRIRASDSGRILNITTPTSTPLSFDDLNSEKGSNSLHSFAAAKMANLLFTFELARRLENTDVRVNALHPGLVRSQIIHEASPPVRWLSWLLAPSPTQVAEEIAHVALAPEYAAVHGKFLRKGKPLEPVAYALDPENQRRLWDVSERLTDAPDALERGAAYDPTGSVAMFNNENIPEKIVRPQDG